MSSETNKITIKNRGAKVTSPEGQIFQLVEIEMYFFGAKRIETFDTIINEDGTQTVIGGDGFIKHGFLLS